MDSLNKNSKSGTIEFLKSHRSASCDESVNVCEAFEIKEVTFHNLSCQILHFLAISNNVERKNLTKVHLPN